MDSDLGSSLRYGSNTNIISSCQYTRPSRLCYGRFSATWVFLVFIWWIVLRCIDSAATNFLERKTISKGHPGNCSRFHKWKPTSREKRLAFSSLAISMGLIIKSSMKALWNIKDRYQKHRGLRSTFYRWQVTDAPLYVWFSRKCRRQQKTGESKGTLYWAM